VSADDRNRVLRKGLDVVLYFRGTWGVSDSQTSKVGQDRHGTGDWGAALTLVVRFECASLKRQV
jgi:hypothetical protein